jgi:hypothetical protein
MIFIYTLCVSPENNEFDYYTVDDLIFNNPIHKDEIIEYLDVELEINNVLHECNGKSFLYVKSDERIET